MNATMNDRMVEILEYCVALTLVLLALPLLALAALVLRGALGLIIVLGLPLAALVYCAHPGIRGRFWQWADTRRI